MSRVGKQPIAVPSGVQVDVIDDNFVRVKGPKGQLERQLSPELRIAQEDRRVVVTRPSDERQHRALHGLTRTLLNNMVVGVSDGFTKSLDIQGVGYRAQAQGKDLQLALGFSHPVIFAAPDGITFLVETPTKIRVQGIDKELVGEIAARIRKLRPPEPYKGKGIRYEGERVRRKAGKAGKAGK
jgi:large subunit ribosomal protein L6